MSKAVAPVRIILKTILNHLSGEPHAVLLFIKSEQEEVLIEFIGLDAEVPQLPE
jgi:hypothetical protein